MSGDRGVRLLQSITVFVSKDEDLSEELVDVAHELIPPRRHFRHDELRTELLARPPVLRMLRAGINGADLNAALVGRVLKVVSERGRVASVAVPLGENFPRLEVVVVAGGAGFAISETPAMVGRAIAAVAADPERSRWNQASVTSFELATHYGTTDVDGTRPDAWGYIVDVEERGLDRTPADYR
ncbi:MAG TPA: hypothetical protein VNS19_08670 [Acidimicrobiales bacterium]|nr:hypothetical protein [Acidimicrobiales bacterium]